MNFVNTMNLWPQILTIPICFILLASLFRYRVAKFPKYIIFNIFVIVTLISVILDLICYYLIDAARNGSQLSASVLNILRGVFIAFRSFSPFIFFLYVSALVDNNFSHWKKRIWIIIPNIIIISLSLISCFIPLFFYYDESFNYHRTLLFSICMINPAFYFIMTMMRIIRFRSILSKIEFYIICCFIFIAILNILCLLIFPSVQMECFGTVLCLILIQINFQRPDEYFDSVSGFLNRRSFANAVKYRYMLRQEFRVGFMIIENFDVIERIRSVEFSEKLIQNISVLFKQSKFMRVYRTSPNTFCFFWKGITTKKKEFATWAKLRRLYRNVFSSPWKIDGEEISVSTKWGMVHCPEEAHNAKDLLHLLGMAKVSSVSDPVGFNTFDSAQLKKIKRRVEITKIISNAVEKNLFYVVFQPIYNTKLKKFTSAEALVRMYDDFLGYISPDEFIPVAEEEGQILKIDNFVFETVCKFIRDNQIEKLGVEYIEINLSPIECLQDDLAERILKTINKYKVDPNQINLEITETSFDKLPRNFPKIMSCMSRAGIGFSLDDYGTGYSNLCRISELPINIIKVDKSLVQGTDSEKVRVILDSTIEMSKLLGTKVLTEGTETIDHVNYVTDRGCDYIQGYYFSKPLGADDYLQFLKDNNS